MISEELGYIRELVNKNLPSELQDAGKMIRVKIGVLILKMLEIDVNATFLKFLSAVELIHNASLFHDDVIDDENIRRDTVSPNKSFGNKQTVLFGNLSVSNAFNILFEVENPEILKGMNNCIKKMCYGELLQLENLYKIPSINDYIKKNRLKTASLFKYMMSGLSLLSDIKYKDKFESFGDNFGISFQISNDLEDYKKGIDKSSDIQSGIYTAPVIYAKSVSFDCSAIKLTEELKNNYLKRAKSVINDLCNDDTNIYKKELIGVIGC